MNRKPNLEDPMADILDKAERYRVRVHRKARSHFLSAKRAQRMHTYLGVPVVVTTTIVGTTIFATLSKQPDPKWQIAAGTLSILAAVLAALQTFFKSAETAEKHRVAGASYAALYGSFDLFLLKHKDSNPQNRLKLIEDLETLIEQFNQLERDSLDVPDRLYDQAVKEQIEDKEGV